MDRKCLKNISKLKNQHYLSSAPINVCLEKHFTTRCFYQTDWSSNSKSAIYIAGFRALLSLPITDNNTTRAPPTKLNHPATLHHSITWLTSLYMSVLNADINQHVTPRSPDVTTDWLQSIIMANHKHFEEKEKSCNFHIYGVRSF